MLFKWIGFAVLLMISSLMAMLEVGLLSLTHIKAQQLLEKNKKIEPLLNLWVKNAKHILASIYTITLLSHIGVILIVYRFFNRLLSYRLSQPLLIGIVLAVSFLILGLSTIIPKCIARGRPDIISLRFVQIMHWMSYVLWLPNKVFLVLTSWLSSFLGIPDLDTVLITEDEIKTIIEMGEQEGTVEESERKMIHSIFDFGDTIVREVMSPRVDIVCISVTSTLMEAVEVIQVNHHSRIPVFKENIDNIVGILYAKDILDYLENDSFRKKPVRDVMHQPLFIPETKLISELLHELRETKTHLAIAVDEYGGTAGIITIEDILEEIIGEIQDEYDTDEEALYTVVNEHEYIVDAKTPINEFKDLLGIEEPLKDEGDYDSVGGYVFSLLGRIPSVGETFHNHTIGFEVLDADEKRIISLKITRIHKQDEQQDGQQSSQKGE